MYGVGGGGRRQGGWCKGRGQGGWSRRMKDGNSVCGVGGGGGRQGGWGKGRGQKGRDRGRGAEEGDADSYMCMHT